MRLVTHSTLLAVLLVSTALLSAGLLAPLREVVAAVNSQGSPTLAEAVVTPQHTSACVAEAERKVDHRFLLLGETTAVTTRATVLCAAVTRPHNVAFVMDGSQRMEGQPREDMIAAAAELVRDMSLGANPYTKVGVVEFNDRARELTVLSNEEARVLRAVRRVGASGATAIEEGLGQGVALLKRGRRSADLPKVAPYEVVLLFSQGHNDLGCIPALTVARKAKSQGMLVVTVCVGTGCDSSCMRRIASSPRYHFRLWDLSQFLHLFLGRNSYVRVTPHNVTITDELPANMQLVPGSAVPEPDQVADYTWRWRFDDVPTDGVTVTYQLMPLEPGWHPTSLSLSGRFYDSVGGSGGFTLSTPDALVLRPKVPR